MYKTTNAIIESLVEVTNNKPREKGKSRYFGFMNYYNGIVFKGFIKGIPTGILSGGQYDNLMGKMGKKSHAIGFAVYLDELSRFYESQEYDVDVAIEYGDAGVDKVNALVKELTKEGKTIFVAKKINEKLKYKELIKID